MNNEISENPLVSVGVLSYNSSKTILETLESIRAQTYINIELIISDDASKDDTVEICKKWVEENKDRFVRCEVLTVPENTGIPANANRSLVASNGEWYKIIAADDTLLPDCIENFINYTKTHSEAEIIFAKFRKYLNNFESKNFLIVSDFNAKNFCREYDTAHKQFKKLLKGMTCSAITMFAKLSVLKEIKYDEKFKMIEDYPMWLRLTKNGNRFYFLDQEVVNYRIHSLSISCDPENSAKGRLFELSIIPFKKEYIYPNLSLLGKGIFHIKCFRLRLFKFLGLLNNSKTSCKLYFIFNILTCPKLWVNKAKEILNH